MSPFGIFSIRYRKCKAKNKLKIHPVSRKTPLAERNKFPYPIISC